MMKLRPKMLEPGKGSLGGLGTWVPVIVVVVAVVLQLADVIPALWAAGPVALALLYTMAEPVVYRVFRDGQFPRWARFAALLAIAGAVAWAVVAAAYWLLPGTIVAEGDLAEENQTLELRPAAPGELRDYLIEVSVSDLPELGKPMSFPYTLRLGREELRGHFGKELVRRRFRGGSAPTLEERKRHFYRRRLALDPKKDKLKLATLVRTPTGEKLTDQERAEAKLAVPLHVCVQEAPFTRLTMALVSLPLLLFAAVVEAFEDRARREKSRLTMLVGGILAAVIYLLVAVTIDNVLMGVLGAAIAGLAGALASFVVAWVVAKLVRRG